MSEAPEPPMSHLRFMVRALAYRNYRLFFGGQIVSLIGTWLTTVATSWLVYRLARESTGANEALLLGVVNFAGQAPIFLVAPFAGVWADRWNRHRILLLTQTLSMVQSFVLAVLALGDWITIPQIMALSAFQGLVNAFDMPARQSFVVEMVENRQDLGNAIALNSSMMHGARLIGPAIGGFLIYRFGEGLCFLIDGFSYLAVIAALAAMRVQPRQLPQHAGRVLASLQEGIRYAAGFRPIRALLLLVAVGSFMAMSQSVLMPIFADQIIGGGERTLGLLLGSAGLGAFLGSVYLAGRKSVLGLGKVISVGSLSLGAGLIGVSLSKSLWLTMPLLMLTGAAMVIQMASANTLLQTIVEDDKRGRIMSLFTTAFFGVAPFGSLAAGALANFWGAPATLALSGAVCLLNGLAFTLTLPSLRPLIRPIYLAKGILAEAGAPAVGPQPLLSSPLPPPIAPEDISEPRRESA